MRCFFRQLREAPAKALQQFCNDPPVDSYTAVHGIVITQKVSFWQETEFSPDKSQHWHAGEGKQLTNSKRKCQTTSVLFRLQKWIPSELLQSCLSAGETIKSKVTLSALPNNAMQLWRLEVSPGEIALLGPLQKLNK